MGTTRRVELPDDGIEPGDPVPLSELSPELLREMYRCGLELRANESAVFLLDSRHEPALSLVVRNGLDGVVDVACSDERVAAELRSFVGFRVALVACEPEVGDEVARGDELGSRDLPLGSL